jgi:hypothetical protein
MFRMHRPPHAQCVWRGSLCEAMPHAHALGLSKSWTYGSVADAKGFGNSERSGWSHAAYAPPAVVTARSVGGFGWLVKGMSLTIC